jgi:transcriptional antiterminator NusG
MGEIEKKWYVLRAIGGKEKKVKELIESEVSRLNIGDYVSQVLIPTEKVPARRSARKGTSSRVMC